MWLAGSRETRQRNSGNGVGATDGRHTVKREFLLMGDGLEVENTKANLSGRTVWDSRIHLLICRWMKWDTYMERVHQVTRAMGLKHC